MMTCYKVKKSALVQGPDLGTVNIYRKIIEPEIIDNISIFDYEDVLGILGVIPVYFINYIFRFLSAT
jgi:hypothetical protein